MNRNLKRGVWRQFNTYADMRKSACGSRVEKTDWQGPGWYWVLTYSQLYPGCCCNDYVFEALSRESYIKELKDEIRELAALLVSARNQY